MKELIMLMDDDICDALDRIASRRDLSIQELIRRFINLGVTVDEIEQNEHLALIVRETFTQYEPTLAVIRQNTRERTLVIE